MLGGIARELQDVEAFDSPIVELEQYPTGVEIAARMLYTVSPRLDPTTLRLPAYLS